MNPINAVMFSFPIMYVTISFTFSLISGENSFFQTVTATKEHATAGTLVNITCRIESNSEPSFLWFRDDQRLDTGDSWGKVTTLKRVDSDNNPNVKVYRSVLTVKTDRNRTYSCEGSNQFGKSIMNIIIYVGNKPKIESMEIKPEKPQPKGRNITVSCKGKSTAKPHLKWIYVENYETQPNGIEIVDTDGEGGFDIDEYTDQGGRFVTRLIFLPVMTDANYSCQAHNVYGTDSKTMEVITVDLKLGESCQLSSDCFNSIGDSDCISGVCKCPDAFPVFIKSDSKCLHSVMFGRECSHSLQCTELDNNTYCISGGSRTCQCQEGHVYSQEKRQCNQGKMVHTYIDVLLAIGSTLVFIVVATLTLYFTRKHIQRKRLLDKIKRANSTLEDDDTMKKETGDSDLLGKKKVHFTPL